MKHFHKVVITAAIVAFVPATARADIYQYTDSNGVVHFSNVSGGGKKHKRVSRESRSRNIPSRETESKPGIIRSSNVPSAYMDIINAACNLHGLDPSLVHAVVKVESDFNPYAMSKKGAMGLMQLMPQTAFDLNVRDSFNPVENINGGVKYLKYLVDRYDGNLSLALAAYNAGETAVNKWGTIPPYKETQNYVKRIMRIYNGGASGFAPRYTIYMGYSDDGALILTDNPSSHPNKKLTTARKKDL